MNNDHDFADAQEMHRANPITFEAPTQEELDALVPEMFVKVCAGRERFWAIIQKIEGDKITAIIDNILVCSDLHGLYFRDEIEFEKRHVYGFASPKNNTL